MPKGKMGKKEDNQKEEWDKTGEHKEIEENLKELHQIDACKKEEKKQEEKRIEQ
jgi:hypothetical protein